MVNKIRIGWIGVGLMGHGAAKNLVNSGYEVYILGNKNRGPINDLCAHGAREANDPKDIAQKCDTVFSCLPSTSVVKQVVYGPKGLIEAARPGLTFVDCTTSEPAATIDMAKDLAARGSVMLDAPFSRTPKEAEEGRLNCMVGGDRNHFNQLQPILSTFCENIFHVGPIGAGHQLKLFNNLLSMCGTALVAEATAAAAKCGIDLQTFYDVVSVGGGDSRSFRVMLPWALEGNASLHQAALSIGIKDLDMFIRTAEKKGAPTSMAKTAIRIFDLAKTRGYGECHMPQLSQVLAAEVGAHIRKINRK